MSRNKWMLLLIASLIIILAGCNGEATEAIDPNEIYTQAAETVAVQRTETAVAEMALSAEEEQEPAEEVDVDMIYTQAAQTVVAEMTLNAPMEEPTATQVEFRPTATLEPTQDTGGQQPVVQPTAVPTATVKVDIKDAASFTYQWPGDDWQFNPGSKFDAVFSFNNIGETEWNSAYTLRWYHGHTFGLDKLKYTLDDAGDKTVVPIGEGVTFTIKGMEAPSAPGTYQSNWRLCNDDVKCFYLVYIQIIVEP